MKEGDGGLVGPVAVSLTDRPERGRRAEQASSVKREHSRLDGMDGKDYKKRIKVVAGRIIRK